MESRSYKWHMKDTFKAMTRSWGDIIPLTRDILKLLHEAFHNLLCLFFRIIWPITIFISPIIAWMQWKGEVKSVENHKAALESRSRRRKMQGTSEAP